MRGERGPPSVAGGGCLSSTRAAGETPPRGRQTNDPRHKEVSAMKLVTYVTSANAGRDDGRAAVLHGDQTLLDIETLGRWAARSGAALPERGLPATMLELLRLGPEGMDGLRAALAGAATAPEGGRRAQG